MKKIYEKPEILFEDFSLSTNIAGDCESIVGNPAKNTCAVVGTGNVRVFTSAVSDCKYTPVDLGGSEDLWDGFCYHVPTEYTSLFNS